MSTFEMKSLPEVRFAHIYHADTYQNIFPIKKDRMEISFISEGSITIECNGIEYAAKKGDVVCLPYFPHQIKIQSSTYHEHHTVQAHLQWIEQVNMNGLYLPIVTPAQLHTKTAANKIEELIRNQLLFKESPTRGAAIFLALLLEIDRCNRNAQKANLPSEVLYTNRAKEYVQNHIHLPITQKAVANYLSITPEYLCMIFKKTEGMTFIKYVNTEKLEAIKNLMEKEHLHLYEAAMLFGYSDPNYVSRLFKKYYQHNITDIQNHQPTKKR